MQLNHYPIIKLALLFVSGILLQQWFAFNITFILALITAVIILFVIHKKIKSIKNFQFISTLLTAILIVGIGNYYAELNKREENLFFKDIHRIKDIKVYGKIDKINLLHSDQLLIHLASDSVRSENIYVRDQLRFLCKIKTVPSGLNKLYNSLKPGNVVSIFGTYYKGREKRNPGEFDYNDYLYSKGITGLVLINSSKNIKVLSASINHVKNLIYQARKVIDENLKTYHDEKTASLLRGLLLADRGEISYETKTQFINAGVIHVLAVSGLHVGYIVLIFILIFGRLNLILRSTMTIIGLVLFMLITGVPPSVFRATVMAAVIIIAYTSNRSTNLFNSLAIAALIILSINPGEIYNPGFQLSFAAVLSIGVIFPLLERWINRFRIRNKLVKYILLFAGVSLSAQVGTIPLTLIYFGKVSVIAVLTNLIVIPAIGVIIGIAIFTLFLSALIPFIAVYFAAANDLISFLMLSLIEFSGKLNFSHLVIQQYSVQDSIIFYLLISFLLYSVLRFKSTLKKSILIILITVNIIFLSKLDDVEFLPENRLSILMVDVGQGDSFLIKFPNNKTALVDAGNVTTTYDSGERIIIPLLTYLGIKKIDYGFISHVDSDHYAGFISLIQNNLIGSIFKPRLDSASSKDVKLEGFIRSRNVNIHYYDQSALQIGNCKLYILNFEKITRDVGLKSNDRSGLFKLVYGNNSILLTGDIEKKVESVYLRKYKHFLNSDVLKVAHHGSKTSSSQQFLEYVLPSICLVSAGVINQFNHPAEEIIKRLENNNNVIYRTDESGAVLLQFDGESINRIDWRDI